MKLIACVLAMGISATAMAAAPVPSCLDKNGNVLPVNNAQVIQWKHGTANEYLDRGHVTGTISKLYKDATGHHHFQVTILGSNETIEFVYDLQFGATGNLQVGQSVEGCGDYITSFAAGGGYQPSPDGALLHWLHISDENKHESGFLVVNDVIYGLQ